MAQRFKGKFGRIARIIQVADVPTGVPDTRPISQRRGHRKVLTYDKMDNVIMERFFEWRPRNAYSLLSRSRFEFDERGRKVREIRDLFHGPAAAGVPGLDAFASAPPTGSTQIESWFYPDGNGRVIELRHGVVTSGPSASPGSCTRFKYDHAGRELVSSVVLLDEGNVEVTRTETTYDLSGNPVRVDRFDFEYDGTGALINTEVITRCRV